MRIEVVARGVPPDKVWAWWTDYREGSGDHAFAGWAHPDRRVERLDDERLRLTETARVGPWRYLEVSELTLQRPRVRFDMRNNVGRFRGHYRFLPDPQGTRIEVVWDETLQGPLRWLGPLGRWGLRQAFRWDLRRHLRDLEQETPVSSAR